MPAAPSPAPPAAARPTCQGVVAYAALSTDGRAQIRRVASGSTSVRTTLDTGRSVVDLSWSHHIVSDGYNYPGGSLFFIDG